MTIDELKKMREQYYIQEIIVDTQKKKYSHISVKQDDNARYVLITVTENGVVKDTSNYTATAQLSRPDGIAIKESLTNIEDGRLLLHFTDFMLAVSGYAEMDITLYKGNDVLSNLQNIQVDIESKPYPNTSSVYSDTHIITDNVISDTEPENQKAFSFWLKPKV